ncbi:hypothetical protein [Marinomonas pollencensis]|uniref:DUF4140 domain-containing protein n=1 Tax=Marinomonas pollencensis TaxID=491954 RepID=A0A3E0DPN4_9GAMM|nr:hypothetical protein [Marinomonas pollencensis]REG84212.1 hypothetical protein DFP81_10491 [Marinomonas pollencensis]
MKKLAGFVLVLPFVAQAQTVEIQPVDIIYGNQVIHGRHQVVLSSPDKVAVIPADKSKVSLLGPNVVVSATGADRSYLEEQAIAKREKAIYDEVNKRTEEAPFTVLFTGHIPDDIQEKRLRMMPEIGVFGEQLNKLEESQSDSSSAQDVMPDSGDFSEIKPNSPNSSATNNAVAPNASQEAKLEKLIGG